MNMKGKHFKPNEYTYAELIAALINGDIDAKENIFYIKDNDCVSGDKICYFDGHNIAYKKEVCKRVSGNSIYREYIPKGLLRDLYTDVEMIQLIFVVFPKDKELQEFICRCKDVQAKDIDKCRCVDKEETIVGFNIKLNSKQDINEFVEMFKKFIEK